MNTAKACLHLSRTPALEAIFVMDQHLYMTDGFVRCAACGATYLIELADIQAAICVFRISTLAPEVVRQALRSLEKGSCDIHRARDEVFSLTTASNELDELLVMRDGLFTGLVPRPADGGIPKRSWRQLPCDGALVRALGLF